MLALAPAQLLQHADRLLLGRFEKAAGVDDEDVGVLLAFGGQVVGAAQQHLDAVAIDFVFGAPQGYQMIFHSSLSSLSHKSSNATIAW